LRVVIGLRPSPWALGPDFLLRKATMGVVRSESLAPAGEPLDTAKGDRHALGGGFGVAAG